MVERITSKQFHEAPGVEDWRVVSDGAAAYFATGSFAKGLEFVDRIGALAEEADHHPDILINYKRVTLTYSTHSEGGLTDKDFAGAAMADKLSHL